ncbi:109_t:CDS:1, partial [Dentiscutata erythropus]
IDYYKKEQTKPFQAPNWIISEYKGILRVAIQNACGKWLSVALPQQLVLNPQKNTQISLQISDCENTNAAY